MNRETCFEKQQCWQKMELSERKKKIKLAELQAAAWAGNQIESLYFEGKIFFLFSVLRPKDIKDTESTRIYINSRGSFYGFFVVLTLVQLAIGDKSPPISISLPYIYFLIHNGFMIVNQNFLLPFVEVNTAFLLVTFDLNYSMGAGFPWELDFHHQNC